MHAMSTDPRKLAELVIKLNALSIEYAGPNVEQLREASRRSDEVVKTIRSALRRG